MVVVNGFSVCVHVPVVVRRGSPEMHYAMEFRGHGIP